MGECAGGCWPSCLQRQGGQCCPVCGTHSSVRWLHVLVARINRHAALTPAAWVHRRCLPAFLLLAAATSSAPFQPWGKPGVVKDSSRSVFVRNLPFEATYEDLASFFSQAGEVRSSVCWALCWAVCWALC